MVVMASPNENESASKKKAKREKLNDNQISMICDFVKENTQLLFGKPLNPSERIAEQRKNKWDELAKKLAATGCPGRSGNELRTTWSELKKRARKYKDERSKTGGGTYKIKPALELVLSSMAHQALDGIKGQESESGASHQSSQNAEACHLLKEMGREIIEESDDVEEKEEERRGEKTEEDAEEMTNKEEAMDQDIIEDGDAVMVVKRMKGAKRKLDFNQNLYYQERLLRMQKSMMETQQKIATTLADMLGVMKDLVKEK